ERLEQPHGGRAGGGAERGGQPAAADGGGPRPVEVRVRVDEGGGDPLHGGVHVVGAAQDGGGEDDGLGGARRDRRVGRLGGGDLGRLGVAALREQRLGEAHAGGGVGRLRFERAPEPALGVGRATALDVGAAGEDTGGHLGRDERIDLGGVGPARDQELDERQHRRDVVGVLGQAAAQDPLLAGPVSQGGVHLGEQRHREEGSGAGGAGVLGRRIAHLEASLGELGGLAQVAAAAGGQGGLEDEVGVVREAREALLDGGHRGVEVADLAAGAGDAGDQQRRVADRLEALLAQPLPRPVEVRAGGGVVGQDEVLGAEVVVGERR